MSELMTANPRPPATGARHFRDVLGLFATGVVTLTALDPAARSPLGLTANSFTAVSLSPPLVSVCIAHTSQTWPRIRAAGGHCVNILAHDQERICQQFSAAGGDRFSGVEWRMSPAGHPVLDGALGWLDCTVETEHTAGDHTIVVSRVCQLGSLTRGYPLVFYHGAYGSFTG